MNSRSASFSDGTLEQPISRTDPVSLRAMVDLEGNFDESKPRLRGWLHAGVTPLVLAGGVVLICLAPAGFHRLAAIGYAISGLLLFGVSAVYHRGNWGHRARTYLKRADHANIYIIIAGSYTPISLLGLQGATRDTMLVFVWAGAAAGVAFRVLWINAPRALYTGLYIALGWCLAPVVGQLFTTSVAAGTLVTIGGVLYTLGAIVYATRWPGTQAQWFGFHEYFHSLTIAAWATQYVAISMLMYQ